MILAFDIGGSAMKGAYGRGPRNLVPIDQVPTPATDFDAFVEVIAQAIAKAPEPVTAVAISITGVIDRHTGHMICANVGCIHGIDLAAGLTARLGMDVTIANDADCFALAEARLGAGYGHDIVFGAILGTGIGGGLVVDGKLANRKGGFAGEWGHGTILATRAGPMGHEIPHFACGCGRMGCVDTVGGARGLERLHHHLHGVKLDSLAITAAWQAGDTDAGLTLECYLDLVSAPLALAINITGASVVPVGGGLARAPGLIDALDTAVRGRVLQEAQGPLLVAAQCLPNSGLVGAALLGFDRING